MYAGIEAVNLPSPRFVRDGDFQRVIPVAEKPVGMLLEERAVFRDRERSDPETGKEFLIVNLPDEPLVSVRESVIRIPVAGGNLIAVVDLDILPPVAPEMLRGKIEVLDDTVFSDVLMIIAP